MPIMADNMLTPVLNNDIIYEIIIRLNCIRSLHNLAFCSKGIRFIVLSRLTYKEFKFLSSIFMDYVYPMFVSKNLVVNMRLTIPIPSLHFYENFEHDINLILGGLLRRLYVENIPIYLDVDPNIPVVYDYVKNYRIHSRGFDIEETEIGFRIDTRYNPYEPQFMLILNADEFHFNTDPYGTCDFPTSLDYVLNDWLQFACINITFEIHEEGFTVVDKYTDFDKLINIIYNKVVALWDPSIDYDSSFIIQLSCIPYEIDLKLIKSVLMCKFICNDYFGDEYTEINIKFYTNDPLRKKEFKKWGCKGIRHFRNSY